MAGIYVVSFQQIKRYKWIIYYDKKHRIVIDEFGSFCLNFRHLLIRVAEDGAFHQTQIFQERNFFST